MQKNLILKLPFLCDVTYKTRLQLTNLLPVSYWHEFLDIVFFYKAANNLVLIDSEALPVTGQSPRFTRSSSGNSTTYVPKRSRNVTDQRSFFIRAFCTWNVLPAELRTSHISLISFKRLLTPLATGNEQKRVIYQSKFKQDVQDLLPGCLTRSTACVLG